MRVLAGLMLLVLLAAPAAAVRDVWEGAGRATIEWPNSECPASAKISLARHAGSTFRWSAALDLVQDAAVVRLSVLCLPGLAHFDFPLLNGDDTSGWSGEAKNACSTRYLRITFVAPPTIAPEVPARAAQIEYSAQGPCVPYGMSRADAVVALGTYDAV